MIATAEHPASDSQRAELAAMVGELERLERAFLGWNAAQRAAVAAYKTAIDALHAEAVRRLVRACKAEPAALAVLRTAVADEVVYSVLRQLEIVKPCLDERVERALASVRPLLAAHGGDVELVRVEPPVVELRFLGACDGCASSAMTFHAGVVQAVRDACPEISDVVQLKGSAGERAGAPVSPFAPTALGAWRYACELAELSDGGLHAVAIRDLRLVVVHRAGEVRCFANACAHLGATLDDAALDDGVITCAHHGFQYDLASGECLTAPSLALTTYPARVAGTRVEVRLVR